MPLRPTPLIAALLLVLIMCFTGCSFTTLERVPGTFKSGDDLNCSDGLSLPLIDMAATVLSGILAVSLISAGDDPESGSQLKTSGFGIAAISLGLASSAIYGTYQVNRCRRARNREGLDARAPLPNGSPTGTQGGACRDDGSCDEELVCDATMRTCIPEEVDSF